MSEAADVVRAWAKMAFHAAEQMLLAAVNPARPFLRTFYVMKKLRPPLLSCQHSCTKCVQVHEAASDCETVADLHAKTT